MSQQRLNTKEIADLMAATRWQQRDGKITARDRGARKAQKKRLGGKPSGGNEGKRIEAVNLLVCEYRSQIAEYKGGERAAIDPLLMQGIGELGLHIFAQDDPEIALARLLGTRQKPGKRTTNTDRNFSITRAVVTKMEGGMTLERAAVAVAKNYRLDPDTIKKIYVLRRREVRAARHEI